MITSKRAALNGAQLDEVHDLIVIQSIDIADGRENITAVSSAAGSGQRITAKRRDTLDITIRFGIDIRRTAMDERAEVLEAVNTWAARAANGAYLTLGYKHGRRLWVHLAQAPGEGNLWEWANDFTITFRAYEIPYWTDDTLKTYTIRGAAANVSGSFTVDGNTQTVVDVELVNMSGMEIRRITSVMVNGSSMAFENLGLLANETLVIDHTDSGLLRIRIRASNNEYRSAMAKRTAASDDDFTVSPGTVSAGFTSERACQMTTSWRCRYL